MIRSGGVDCATDPRKVGLALAEVSGTKARLLAAERGSAKSSLAGRIAEWMGAESRVLLALDAPLGWPRPLGDALSGHRAGQPILGEPNQLFRRLTDRTVAAEIGKLPLDVGADRIARTAVAALALVAELRALSGCALPLAWDHELREPSVIEVYPAGTLAARGLRSSGYKERGQAEQRREILRALAERVELPVDRSELEQNADVLDAGLCVLAALDFLAGDVIEPEDAATARREGWIWVRHPARRERSSKMGA